jgi:hypothetical protein
LKIEGPQLQLNQLFYIIDAYSIFFLKDKTTMLKK